MATRRASVLWTVLIVSVMMLVASHAWAVVVDMTVKDRHGSLVSGAEVTFTSDDPADLPITGTTDMFGKVRREDGKPIEVPLRPHKVRVRGRHNVTATETWPGDTASFTMTVDPIVAWMVQNPPCSLCFGLGAGYYGQWIHDHELQRGEITTIRIPGMAPIIERDGSFVNRFNFDLNAGVTHIPIGVSPVKLGGVPIYSAFHFQAGVGDLTINTERRSDSLPLLSLRGSGTVVGAGGSFIATSPNRSWYLGFTYDYSTLINAELKHDPCPLFGATTSCRSMAWVNSHSHSFSSRIGLNLPTYPVSPFLGIGGTLQNSDVKFNTIQNFPGLGEVTFDTMAQFARNTVEGIAGVDAHFGGPLFGRFVSTFNGSDVSLMFKIIYGIGFVDPYLSPGPRHTPL